MGPWTRRLTLPLQTTLSFFENRLAALREFEAEGLLHQVRVEEERVSVRLGDPNHLLTFGPRQLEVALLQPTGDLDRVATAVERVWKALDPARVSGPTFQFQWLVPLEDEYDTARRRAIGSLLGQSSVVSLTDWSMVLNAEGDKPPGVITLEMGIVEAAEAPQRLGRLTGLFRGQGAETPPTIWTHESLPEVAFFVDMIWAAPKLVDATPEGVLSLWSEATTSAGELVSELIRRIMGVDDE